MSLTAPISKQFSKTVNSKHLKKEAWLQFDHMRKEVNKNCRMTVLRKSS